MGEAPMTAADVGAVLGNRGGFGDMGGGFWIFALLILPLIANGGWGFGGNGGQALTVADNCMMDNFGRLENQVGRMNDMQFQEARNTDNAICTLGYQALQHKDELAALIASAKCEIEKTVMAENQATRNMIRTNKEEAMQQKINQLELNQALSGVVRYPQQFVYSTGNPFFSCNNTCNNTLF